MNAAVTPLYIFEGALPGCFGAQDPNLLHCSNPHCLRPQVRVDQRHCPFFMLHPGEGDALFGLTRTPALALRNTSLL
jgi:hypothetical protein